MLLRTSPLARMGQRLWLQCPNATAPLKPRFFSSSIRSHKAVSKSLPSHKPSASPLPPPRSPPSDAVVRAELAARFAGLTEPLTLYKNTRVKSFLLGAYGTAMFCGTYALLAMSTLRLQKEKKIEGIQSWATSTISVVSVLMGMAGGFFYLRASRLVTKISIVPHPKALTFRVDVRRNIPLPWIKPKSITIPASKLAFPSEVKASSVRHKFGDGATERPGPFAYILLTARPLLMADIAEVKIEGTKGVWKVDTLGEFNDVQGVNLFNYGNAIKV